MLYASTGYVDELAWAAAWLFKATGNQQYLTDAKTYYAKVERHGNAGFPSVPNRPSTYVNRASYCVQRCEYTV